MSGFILCKDKDCGQTLVPDFFLDHYMPGANGEYVKIYLYLLRCLKSEPQELSLSLIADRFEHTESDVRRALTYWEKMKLLKLEYDSSKQLTGIRLLDGPQDGDADAGPAEGPDANTDTAPARPLKTAPETAAQERIPKDLFSPEEARQLLFICEQYLGKTLSSREVAQLLDFHDSLGFSAELIEYLVEYCVSGGHKSLHYIEATALAWHKSGIRTVTEARQQTTTYNRAYFRILKAFGISNRNPVDVEIAYMDKWMKTWGFSLEMITEACSRTMAAIHQPGFEYADKILSEWRRKKAKTLQDLEALDRSRRTEGQEAREKGTALAARRNTSQNHFHNFREREYDFDKLQKQLINQ